jgi:23S rRNA (guanosine2251-2'-O)-methyltransferase
VPLIYGINPLLEQLTADPSKLEHIYLQKGPLHGQLGRVARLAREAGVAFSFVDKKALNRMAGGEAHQGAVAEVGEYDYAQFEEIIENLSHPARLLLLDNIQDPRNLGSIVRTAVCAGADGIVIPKRNAASMTGAAVKTSAGGAAVAKVARVTNMVRALEALQERKVWCVAVEAGGKEEISALDPSLDYAFVFGGEGEGIRRLLRERCDMSARIPMRGPLDSLNVAVAVGVTLFTLMPSRGGQESPPASGQVQPPGNS